jgi:hypothetical protein
MRTIIHAGAKKKSLRGMKILFLQVESGSATVSTATLKCGTRRESRHGNNGALSAHRAEVYSLPNVVYSLCCFLRLAFTVVYCCAVLLSVSVNDLKLFSYFAVLVNHSSRFERSHSS